MGSARSAITRRWTCPACPDVAVMIPRFGLNRFDSRSVESFAADVRRAEQLGWDAALQPDSQLRRRDTYVLLAAAAQATERITLGPLLANPVNRHPTVTASSIATIDELAPGRVLLGWGVGDTAVRLAGLRPARVAELEAGTRLMRALLAGEAVEVGAARPARLPHHRPVPVWVAAGGPKTLRMAGGVADGVFIRVGTHPANIATAVRAIHAGAAEAGRDPAAVKLGAIFHTVLVDEPARALTMARSMAAGYYEYSPALFDPPALTWTGPDPETLKHDRGVWPDFHHATDLEASGKVVDFLPTEAADAFSLRGAHVRSCRTAPDPGSEVAHRSRARLHGPYRPRGPPAGPQGARGALTELLVDELDDARDRPLRRRGLLVDIALGLALDQLEILLTADLPVPRDKAVQIGARVRHVARTLDVDHRRRLDGLAALERERRVALGHRLLGAPVRVVPREHTIDDVRIRGAARLQRLGIAVTREGIDDRPAEHRAAHAPVRRGGSRGQRQRRVLRVARLHREEHGQVRAARGAHEPDLVGAPVELGRVALEPADRVADVHQRPGVGGLGRLAEVERGHDHAAPGQRLVHDGVVGPVAATPGPAVQLDDHRERPVSPRDEHPGQQGPVPMTEILHVSDVDLVTHGRHGNTPL